MKKYIAALSVTALIGAAPYALAESTVLTVTGLIIPQACTPTLSHNGLIELGKISAKDLDQTNSTEVGLHPMQLSVSCTESMKFALKTIESSPGSSFGSNYFGLGLTDAGEKLGGFRINIKNVLADGKAATAGFSYIDENSWTTTTRIDPNVLITAVAAYPSLPIDMKDLTMDLEVSTLIARADSLTLTDDVPINSTATFEMIYL